LTTTEAELDPDQDGEPAARGTTARDRRFVWLLLAIVVLAFGVRMANTFAFTNYQLGGDAAYFHGQAEGLADGHGFSEPFRLRSEHVTTPSARHPPAFTIFLATLDLLGIRDVDAQRGVSALLGCATVAVLGIIGRRIAGATVGLVAAGIAAVLPALVIADAQLLSEGLYGLAMGLTLLTAYRYWDEPTLPRAAALSAAVALAALTRGEALLLYALLVVPLVWLRMRGRPRGDLVRPIGIAAAVAVLLVGPWVVYNTRRFSHFAYSTNSGAVVMLANCAETYDLDDPRLLGYWSGACVRPERPGKNEAEADSDAMSAGVGYATSHLDVLPLVAAARVGRMLDVFKPAHTVLLDAQFEGRGVWQSELTMLAFFASIAFAVPGLVILRRRGILLFPLFALGALALLSAVLTYGNVRFRIPLDVALVLPAAVGVVAAVGALRGSPGPAGARQ
jgi:hypothetical protein